MPETQIRTLADCVLQHARRTPNRTAIEFKQRRLSYAELSAAALRFARGLQASGIGRGDRVAFLGRNSELYFVVLFGCSFCGAIFVPVNWRLAAAELDEILVDAAPRLLVADRSFACNLRPQRGDAAWLRLFSIDPVSGVHDLAPAVPDALSDEVLDGPMPLQENDVAALVYTSGTTGRAKGVMLRHDGFISRRRAEQQSGAWLRWNDPDERVLAALPMFHVGGLNAALMGLYQGATVCVVDHARPEELAGEIAERRITRALIVPALLGELLALPEERARGCSSLKTILYGSSPIAPALLARAIRAFQCDFVQLFGMTETTGACTFLAPADHDPARPQRLLSVGQPAPGMSLEARDPTGQPLPPNQVGEIWIQGPTLMSGYWNRPADTAAVMVGGWYRSGDAGYRDEAGYWYLTDRIKDMIVSGGENVYPAEVERVLAAHPAVREVAVIGVPHEKWGEAVLAVVVVQAGLEVSAEALIVHARQQLAGYKLPKSVEFVGALPRNALGKILKQELRRPYWAGHARGIA